MLKKLKIGLILLLLIEIGCARQPVFVESRVSSVLFSFSAYIDGKNYSSLRVYVNSDGERITINVLMPTNKLIANVFYNGERLIIVDYTSKIAYIDNKKPFDLKRVVKVDIPVDDFARFYNDCYLKSKCESVFKGNVRIIVNKKREIVIIGERGNVVLKPLSKILIGRVRRLNFLIPEGFKVVYEDN